MLLFNRPNLKSADSPRGEFRFSALRPRLSVCTLLCLATLVAICCSVAGIQLRERHKWLERDRKWQELGFMVLYDDDRQPNQFYAVGQPLTTVVVADWNLPDTLECLICRRIRLRDADLAGLECLPKLKIIALVDASLTDDALQTMARCGALTRLNISGNSISDAGISNLAKIRTLQFLDITRTDLSPHGVAELRRQLPDTEIVAQ
jgi:hypothetical protein